MSQSRVPVQLVHVIGVCTTEHDGATRDQSPLLLVERSDDASFTLTASLEGSLTVIDDCVFLQSKHDGQIVQIVWPDGTSWDWIELLVTLADGKRIGLETQLRLGGGFIAPDELLLSEASHTCRQTNQQEFLAASIVQLAD